MIGRCDDRYILINQIVSQAKKEKFGRGMYARQDKKMFWFGVATAATMIDPEQARAHPDLENFCADQ